MFAPRLRVLAPVVGDVPSTRTLPVTLPAAVVVAVELPSRVREETETELLSVVLALAR
jgi:hypothetical protein